MPGVLSGGEALTVQCPSFIVLAYSSFDKYDRSMMTSTLTASLLTRTQSQPDIESGVGGLSPASSSGSEPLLVVSTSQVDRLSEKIQIFPSATFKHQNDLSAPRNIDTRCMPLQVVAKASLVAIPGAMMGVAVGVTVMANDEHPVMQASALPAWYASLMLGVVCVHLYRFVDGKNR